MAIIQEAIEKAVVIDRKIEFFHRLNDAILQYKLPFFRAKIEPHLNPEVLNLNRPNPRKEILDGSNIDSLLLIYCALRYGVRAVGNRALSSGEKIREFLEQQGYLRSGCVRLCIDPDSFSSYYDEANIVYMEALYREDTYICKHWMLKHAQVGAQYIALGFIPGFSSDYFIWENIEAAPEELGGKSYEVVIYTKKGIVPAGLASQWDNNQSLVW
jgi:hypothetical protein